MTVHTGLLRLETEGEGQIVDLTEGVLAVIRQSDVAQGLVSVFVTGSTAAVTTMEYEPGGVQDLQEALERLVPRARPGGGDYAHNVLNGDDNAHSHLRASLLGPSETVPLVGGPAGARDLAAARPDRLRRPPAAARSPRPDRVLSARAAYCYSLAPLGDTAAAPLKRTRGARYNPLPARDRSYRARPAEETPSQLRRHGL